MALYYFNFESTCLPWSNANRLAHSPCPVRLRIPTRLRPCHFYQKVYDENYQQIKSILNEAVSLGKGINLKQVESSLKHLNNYVNRPNHKQRYIIVRSEFSGSGADLIRCLFFPILSI
jgi:hypothetical protein